VARALSIQFQGLIRNHEAANVLLLFSSLSLSKLVSVSALVRCLRAPGFVGIPGMVQF